MKLTKSHRQYVPATIIVLVALLIGGGCGGSDSSNSDKASDASSAKSGQDEAPDADTSTDGTDKLDEQLAELVARQKENPYKITYAISTSSNGEEDSSSEITVATDGERTAITVEGSQIFQEGTTLTTCSDSGGSQQCFELPAGDEGAQEGALGALAGTFMGAAESITDPESGAEKVDGREIAGRQAECWTFSYAALLTGAADATACLDAESGAPLLIEWGAETGGESGSYRSEAVSYAEPEESDLTPPADAMKMEDLAAQAAAGAPEGADAEAIAEAMAAAGGQ